MAILLAIVVVIYYVLLYFTETHEPILTELCTTFGKTCILKRTINEINIQGM